MRSCFVFLLITAGCVLANVDVNKVVGYFGPACTVVDDLFYLHGHFIRRLHPEEVLAFKKYQSTLSLLRQLRDAVAKGATLLNNGSISLPTPQVPEFCNGFDDTVELVLDGCTVRGGHVYIADRLIRPINMIEKQRVNMVIASYSAPPRQRRSTNATAETTKTVKQTSEAKNSTENPTTTQSPTTTTPFISAELKEFISNALNINANITDRFLPVAQMSPLFQRFLAPNDAFFGPRNDDNQNSAFADRVPYGNVKVQKRSGLPNSGPATEIPHLFVDERNGGVQPMAVNPTASNSYDPLLLQLLQSLALRQQNINEIIRQQQIMRQQLQSQVPLSVPPSQPLVMPPTSAMKAGDKILIGGQPYLVVQLNPEAGNAGLGLVPAVPASTVVNTVTALPPNGWSNSAPTHYGPNAGIPSSGYGIPFNGLNNEQIIRFSPSRRPEMTSNVPLFANGVPLPHDICRAHLFDPFVWARS
ncbi:Pepsin-I3 domain-containing protein [Aphelenchoides besseyi]|nr:Pepsin-I3 domain-containing protein [Aphelenchoides besseyi]KAI6228034.1 Pepsin-I3 domain-containing protein [Aphelenchoides besseyi]